MLLSYLQKSLVAAVPTGSYITGPYFQHHYLNFQEYLGYAGKLWLFNGLCTVSVAHPFLRSLFRVILTSCWFCKSAGSKWLELKSLLFEIRRIIMPITSLSSRDVSTSKSSLKSASDEVDLQLERDRQNADLGVQLNAGPISNRLGEKPDCRV